MQYAEVLTKQKTKQWDATFTYELAPETLPYIKIGSFVEVPFGNKKIEGVVVGLKKTVPANIKTKKIIRLIQSDLQISPEELKFSKWLGMQYLTTWSEALFSILPPIPKKDINQKIEYSLKDKNIGHHYILSDNNEKRYDYYLEVLRKNREKNMSVWLIFPDLKILEKFKETKKQELENYTTVTYSSLDNLTTRFKKWQMIRSGKYDLLIGSRMALLTLPNNVGTIIIDEPSQNGHQEDQFPRYHSRTVADYWKKTLGINILSGDILPSLKDFVEAKNNQATLISKKFTKPDSTTYIVDMAKEKRLISHPFEKALEYTVKNNKNILIYLPKKGMGSVTRCKDCGHVFNCPNCSNLLTFHQAKKDLICHSCSFHQQNSGICPKCSGNSIATFGLGLEKVAQMIMSIVGDYPIIIIDKEHELKTSTKNAIYIATQAILRYSLNPDITVVVDADLSLNNPEYKSSEELFYLLIKLAFLTKEKLLIQTHEPELELYHSIQMGKYQLFINELLKQRRQHNYPPYGNIAKINFSKLDPDKFQKISQYFQNRQISTQLENDTIILKADKEFSRAALREILATNDKVIFDPGSL